MTVVVLSTALAVGWKLAEWAIVRATWAGASGAECRAGGACWAFLGQRFGQFVFGFYPPDERWRVVAAFVLLLPGAAGLLSRRTAHKLRVAVALLTVYPLVAFWLLHGGAGLAVVPTRMWGGLMLTCLIGVVGVSVSLPVGILLALARRSANRTLAISASCFIEFWRGVPLIAVLFLALIMLPALLPPGPLSDPLVVSLLAISIFTSAYMAETVRGGLQAMAPGQEEAATALGLKRWQATLTVVLPQALRTVLPGLVNVTIALFKDTTLVMVVGLFDIMSIAKATVSDPSWLGLGPEAYIVVGLVFWAVCFSLSQMSRKLEQREAEP